MSTARLIPFPIHRARSTRGSWERIAQQEFDALMADLERALAQNHRIQAELAGLLDVRPYNPPELSP